MALPTLKSGICGCNLKQFALFAGWFSLIVSFISLGTIAYLGTDAVDNFKNQPEGTAVTAEQMAQIITYVTFGLILFLVVFNVLMLVGIYKENSCFIFPYICIRFAVLIMALFGMIQILISGRFATQNISGLVYGAFDAYLVFILYSYYRSLKDMNGRIYNQQIVDNNPYKGSFA